jgi:hypothetical protein
MLNHILLYLGSTMPLFWGTSHLLATRPVVRGFGDISLDNRRIIAMEWIVEGVALIFIGVLTASVTCADRTSVVSTVVYWLSFGVLNTLSVVSLFTGFRIRFLPFKLCPFLFISSSLLIILGRYFPF